MNIIQCLLFGKVGVSCDLDATMKEDITGSAKVVQKSFFRRYAFFLILAPSIIGLHYVTTLFQKPLRDLDDQDRKE